MAQVTLWSRDSAVGVPGATATGLRVAVTYSTITIPPRSIAAPLAWYREATADELKANPRLRFYPKDKAAEAAEAGLISADLLILTASAPPTLEVP